MSRGRDCDDSDDQRWQDAGEPMERGREIPGPGPTVVDSDLGSALPADKAGGDMEQPVAQRPRLGLGQLTAQQGGLGPRDQIRGGQRQLQPDPVDLKLAGWKPAETGLLDGLDRVLDPGVSAVPGLQPGQLAGRGVGRQRLVAPAVQFGCLRPGRRRRIWRYCASLCCGLLPVPITESRADGPWPTRGARNTALRHGRFSDTYSKVQGLLIDVALPHLRQGRAHPHYYAAQAEPSKGATSKGAAPVRAAAVDARGRQPPLLQELPSKVDGRRRLTLTFVSGLGAIGSPTGAHPPMFIVRSP
jgi:hypothetical protein